MRATIEEFITGVLIIAGIYAMVRPNSKGPAVVKSIMDAMTKLTQIGTGQGGTS